MQDYSWYWEDPFFPCWWNLFSSVYLEDLLWWLSQKVCEHSGRLFSWVNPKGCLFKVQVPVFVCAPLLLALSSIIDGNMESLQALNFCTVDCKGWSCWGSVCLIVVFSLPSPSWIGIWMSAVVVAAAAVNCTNVHQSCITGKEMGSYVLLCFNTVKGCGAVRMEDCCVQPLGCGWCFFWYGGAGSRISKHM